MKAFVTYYRSRDDLYKFIEKNGIVNSDSLLIQIFTAHNVESTIQKMISEIDEVLPKAIIIGSTTDGEIANGEFSRNGTVISFTLFEHSVLKCDLDTHADSFTRGVNLANKLQQDDNKLFIVFSEGLKTNGEELLKGIESIAPDVKVAGGLAGDYSTFEKTLVFTKNFIISNGVVGVSVSSPCLRIFNDYNFNWQKIGKKLTITKSKGNKVYEIDGRSAIDTYKHYLGEKVAYKIPAVCIEFPLLVEEDGVLTARSVLSASGDGSLVFAANIKEGSKVYFGYGNPEEILKHTHTIPQKLKQFKPQATFVYSCMARLHFVGAMINQELKPLVSLAPMSGFFTYGEFFSSSTNRFLNQTMTVLALSEDIDMYNDISTDIEPADEQEWNSTNALIHLVNRTTQELVEYYSLKSAYKKFEELFEYSGNAIAVIINNQFIECNNRLIELFGYSSKDEFLSLDILELIDDEYKRVFRDKLAEVDLYTKDKIEESVFEVLGRYIDGTSFWLEITISVKVTNDTHVLYVIYRDITSRKDIENSLREQTKMLYHKAYHDELTGLANRKHFLESLKSSLTNLKPEYKLAVLFIDLDKLKVVNDSLGHDIGDVMIQTVANRLKEYIADNGLVARLGGDEFMVMIDTINSISQVKNKANEILEIIQKPIELEHHTFYSSASIGIAVYPDDCGDEHSLLKYSDTAMYKAKEDGGNRYAFYKSYMSQKVVELMDIEKAFISAIRNNEFEIFYQPQYDLDTKKIVSVEALIRWNHPQKGFLTPDSFLPLLKKLNLLYRLDKWLMNQAMKEFLLWEKQGIAPKKLSLNIGMNELTNANWEHKVSRSMHRLAFQSSWLEFELSEKDLIKYPQRVSSLLHAIKQRGIDIVIDNFGTGYASLKQLRELPVSKIKVDKSYVSSLLVDKDSFVMFELMVSLAKQMGIKITAEGVETEQQLEILRKSGCDYVQGYLYSKPVNVEEMTRLLKQNAQ